MLNPDSEFGFGVQRKEQAERWFGRLEFGESTWPNLWAQSSEKGTGRTLVRQVRSSEKEPFFFYLFFSYILFIFFYFFFYFFIFISFFFFFSSFFLFLLFFFFFSSFFYFLPYFLFLFFFKKKEPVFLPTPNLPNHSLNLPNKVSTLSFLGTCQGSEFGESNWPFLELRTCRTSVGPVLIPNCEPARVRCSEKGTGLSPNSKPTEPGLYPFFLQTETPNSGQKHNP